MAIDGKIVRRTMNGEIPPIHIVSAWASEQNLVIGQVKTEIKSNEITIIPNLLSMLSLTSDEVRYFISSRKRGVREFATATRKHWSIENSLHRVLDIVFREDESRIRTRHAATNFVTLKHITLNMIKSMPGKASMRVRRKRAGWDDSFLLAVLAAPPAA